MVESSALSNGKKKLREPTAFQSRPDSSAYRNPKLMMTTTFRSYTQAGSFSPELPMKRCFLFFCFPVHEATNPACG
jgi:hypothetical protein